MKKIFSSFFKRPVKNWNVENRAQKVLEKQQTKPASAPRHPSTVEALNNFSRENPEMHEAQKTKNESLHKMLEGMIVNPDKVAEIKSSSRPLPELRGQAADLEYGYLEPKSIPPGKISIRQCLEFVSAHHTDPTTHTAQEISRKYSLDLVKVKLILQYFQTLHIQLPKPSDSQQQVTSGTSNYAAQPKRLGKDSNEAPS